MKPEHFIFFIFILAAAVVTGSTFSFAAHFPYIVERAETLAVADRDYSTAASTSEVQYHQYSAEQESASVMTAGTKKKSTDLLVIDAQEKEQIMQMLVSLGMHQEANYQEFIRDFQAQNELTPTGSLDSITLKTIIAQVQLAKTAELVR